MSDPENALEAMCARYWNSFRDGFIAVGGDPKAYPDWKNSRDPVKRETMRCMRHAVEALRSISGDGWPLDDFARVFPDEPERRKLKRGSNDDDFARQYRMGKIEDKA